MFPSLYQFDGHARLALGFGNPNLAGGLLVMLAVVAWAFVWLWPQRRRLALALATAVTLPIYLLVGLTYSRGAYMALAGALTALALLRTRRAWRLGTPRIKQAALAWLPPALFLAVLLCIPAGGKRLAGVTNYSGDLSILHRLYLWQGGAMLIAQYPRHGVGDTPGRLYERFYQPLGKDEHYAGMINDFLFHATSRGLPTAGMLLSLALLPVFLALATWHRHGDEFTLQLGGALVAFLLAGLFNTCTSAPSSRWCYGVIAAIILLRTIWKSGRGISYKLLQIKNLYIYLYLAIPCFALLASLTVCCGVYLLGRHFAANWYFTAEPDVLACQSAQEFWLRPRTPNGVRIEFFAERPLDSLRTELLPLVARGHAIHAHHAKGGLEGVETIRQALENAPSEDSTPGRWLVMASGDAANAAFAAVAALPEELQPDGVALHDAILRHPFPELAVETKRWDHPVVIIPAESPDEVERATLERAFPQLLLMEPQAIVPDLRP